MANKKISELTAFTTLADNDVLAGVDTSASETKKLPLSVLKAYVDTDTTYTAGTNIEISNSNVISAPNVYNKTEVDTSLDNVEDSLQTQLDDNVEDLKSQIEALKTVYNAFPTTTGTGTSASLDGTAEVTFKKLDLYGNTSQETTLGTNLLPISLDILNDNNSAGTWSGNVYSYRGLTYTYNEEDGSITVNGTLDGTDALSFYIARVGTSSQYSKVTLPSGTYYFTANEVSGASNTYKMKFNISGGSEYNVYGTGTAKEGNATFTGSSDMSVSIFIYGGQNLSNVKFCPMIATTSGATYEKYTYGASPNPNYPQDVEVVSGDNKVCVTNKNIFTTSKIGTWTKRNTPFEVTYNNENEFVLSSTNTSAYGYAYSAIAKYPATIGKTYTLSYNVTNKTNTGTADADMVNLNATYVEPTNIPMGSKTITATEPYIYIYAEIGKQSGTAPSATITNIQIEEGSTASTYEVHQETDYDINLPVENLFVPFEYTRTSNSVTFTYSLDGYINANGTASGTAISILSSSASSYLITLKAGTYTISGGTNQVAIEVLNSSGTGLADTNYNYSKSFTISEQTQVFIRLKMDTGKSASNVKIYPMLEKGSKANSYTPYGTTPIEMCKIGDYKDTFKKSTGANLFSSELELGSIDGTTGELVNNSNCVRTKDFIEVEAETTYTLGNNRYYQMLIYFYQEDGTYISTTSSSAVTYTFTTPSNCTKIRVRSNVNLVQNKLDTMYMLQKGDTLTKFEPYGTGIWYAYKEIGKIVLNGSESWTRATSTYAYYFYMNRPTNWYGPYDAYSNHFKYMTQYTNKDNSIYIGSTRLILSNILLNGTYISEKTDLQNWLSTNNDIIYCPLATPVGIDIPQTLKDQLDELERAYSYENKTNVYQENNDKPFELDTEAIKSLKNILN